MRHAAIHRVRSSRSKARTTRNLASPDRLSHPSWENDSMSACPKCGTDHEGHEDGSWGAAIRCLRIQAQVAEAGHLVDQIDALEHDRLTRLDRALFGD